jgi:hypothetical protein
MARDPLRTLDVIASRCMRTLLRGDILPSAVLSQDPDSRFRVWTIVNYAWCLLAAAWAVGIIVVVGIPVQLAFGDAAAHVVAATALATGFFCLAGCANALWRGYWLLPKARRARERHDHAAFEAAFRRTEPRNGTVVFQLAVGILTFVIVAMSKL